MPVMTPDDQKYLRLAFADLMNLLSDDPLDPIDPTTYREPSGDTCLHIAAISGDLRAAQILLSAGLALPEANMPTGLTPAPLILQFEMVLLLFPLVAKVPAVLLINTIPLA